MLPQVILESAVDSVKTNNNMQRNVTTKSFVFVCLAHRTMEAVWVPCVFETCFLKTSCGCYHLKHVYGNKYNRLKHTISNSNMQLCNKFQINFIFAF